MHKKQDKRAYPFKKKHFQSQHCFETRTFVGGTGKENQHKKEEKKSFHRILPLYQYRIITLFMF